MTNDKVKLMQGNEAVVEAALTADLKFFAGYPITPSTEIAEKLAARLPKAGGRFIQMEDELASISAVIGASLTGAKAMTATSGPGFSLMQESIGYAVMAEVACVIVDVQRLGPSTGIATAPAQGDVMQSRWGTHGDIPAVALCPSGVAEAYSLTIEAFNIAERLRTPVILLMDEVVGHMREGVTLPDPGAVAILERTRPADKSRPFYRPGESGFPLLPDFGTGFHMHVTGLAHDERGLPTNDAGVAEKSIRRLHEKVKNLAGEITFTSAFQLEDAEVAVVAYGSVARSSLRAIAEAQRKGIKAGLLQLKTIWPFPEKEIAFLSKRVKEIVVPEMNLGQLVTEVRRAAVPGTRVTSYTSVRGKLITPDEILSVLEGKGDSVATGRLPA